MYAAAGSEAPTEADADDFVMSGGKRIPLSSLDSRYVTHQYATPFTSLTYFIDVGP